MRKELQRRREFLRHAGQIALAFAAPARLLSAGPESLPNPVGCATITWPRKNFPHALETISSLGYRGVQLLGWTRGFYSGAGVSRLKEQLHALKLQPVALSCSNLPLAPGGTEDPTAAFHAYVDFWKGAGGRFLQITDGGRPGRKYSASEIRSLAARMNELGKAAQDSGLTLGYHPHFGTIGETREGLGQVLDTTDPASVKLIADVAHLRLGGADPVEVIRTYRDRLLFTHFKDVRKDVAKLAQRDRNLVRNTRPHFCEVGEGVVDFPAIRAAFHEVGFRGWVIVELDDAGPGGPDESARVNKAAVERLGMKL